MFLTKDKRSTYAKLIYLIFYTVITTTGLFITIFLKNNLDLSKPIIVAGFIFSYIVIFIFIVWFLLIQIMILIMHKKGKNIGFAFGFWKFLTFNNKKTETHDEINDTSIKPIENFKKYVKDKRNVILILVLFSFFIFSDLYSFYNFLVKFDGIENQLNIFQLIYKIISLLNSIVLSISIITKNLIVMLSRSKIKKNNDLTKLQKVYLTLTFRKKL